MGGNLGGNLNAQCVGGIGQENLEASRGPAKAQGSWNG